jgi:cathepsin L
MNGNRRRPITLFAAFILVASGAAIVRGATSPSVDSSATFQTPAEPNPKFAARIRKANADGAAMLRLDDEARTAFLKEHPGVLPETKLRLPNASARAFDWCNLNMLSQTHEQLTGDCWAVAAIETLEASYLLRNDRRVILSPQPILDYLRLGRSDVAGDCPTAFDYFIRTGTTTCALYPYTGRPSKPSTIGLPYRAVAWGFVTKDEQPPPIQRVKESVLRFGPLATGILFSQKLSAYRGGLFTEPDPPNPNHVRTNHAMVIVGWDDSRGPHGAWKVKGTWGPAWGEQGYMWIAYGSNNVAYDPMWVRAASVFYDLPADAFARIVPGAKSLPAVHRTPSPKSTEKLAARNGSTDPGLLQSGGR